MAVNMAAERTKWGEQPLPEQLDAYLGLGRQDIARLVLCLLMAEALENQLASFRSQNLPAQPVER
jgi:hypothetical protein